MKVCICGSRKYRRDKVYWTRWGPVHVVHCSQCGLARDVFEYSHKFFYTDEANIYTPPSETEFQQQLQRIELYLTFINAHIKDSKERASALDIGCNAGFLLQALQKYGWSSRGLEINPSVAKFAALKGFDVISEPLEKTTLHDGSFDLITMSHVLEHIPCLGEYLKQVLRLLKPGGYFFVAVPNFGSRAYRVIYRGRWSCFLPGQHIWYFTKASLRLVCESFGFEFLAYQTLIHMSPESRFPFGNLVKRVIILWMRLRDEGDELLGLFQKPHRSP